MTTAGARSSRRRVNAALVIRGGWAKTSTQPQDDRHTVLTPNTEEQCLKALDDMVATSSELLAKTE